MKRKKQKKKQRKSHWLLLLTATAIIVVVVFISVCVFRLLSYFVCISNRNHTIHVLIIGYAAFNEPISKCILIRVNTFSVFSCILYIWLLFFCNVFSVENGCAMEHGRKNKWVTVEAVEYADVLPF